MLLCLGIDMTTFKVDHDSVHAGDDMSLHEVTIEVNGSMSIEELLVTASKECLLPAISGGKTTWLVYVSSNPNQYLGVLAQQ